MTPYYSDPMVTLYHARWEDVPPELLKAGLVLSDPPYGIAYNREAIPQGKHLPARRKQVLAVEGDDAPFDPAPFIGGRAILWGANCYADRLPASAVWLAWDKVTRNGLALRIGEAEFAWTNCVARTRIFRHLWSGGYRASDIDRDQFLHPTQKPVALMGWCLSLVPDARSVLDPFAGSGSTLVAAKRRGISSIGVECVERYCEVAADRCRQEVLGLVG